MKGRRFVWSDPEVTALLAHFVPATDEVSHLQRGEDAECRLFQTFAEQGHYGGRTIPSRTRQGTYAVAPSGALLASINTTDPARMAEMMRQGLARWEALSREERLLAADGPAAAPAPRRGERLYPEGGLVLRVNSRDLPRETDDADWTARAWNQDFAWFTKAEARQLLPERPAPGLRYEFPTPLFRRIVCCHLIDNVRGQTRPWDECDVEKAVLTIEVTAVDGDRVSLRLRGETRTAAKGVWSIHGYADMHTPTPQRRGMETSLLGQATYGLQAERFVAFEMVALGTRWGATHYNVRYDDLAPASIGIAFTLAGESPSERVAPAFLRVYGWE